MIFFFFSDETLNLFGLLLTTVTQSCECELRLTSAGENLAPVLLIMEEVNMAVSHNRTCYVSFRVINACGSVVGLQ